MVVTEKLRFHERMLRQSLDYLEVVMRLLESDGLVALAADVRRSILAVEDAWAACAAEVAIKIEAAERESVKDG